MFSLSGAVLSFAQWLELRGKVQRTGIWIPANMLAWTFGMPVIFLCVDMAFKMTAIWPSVLVMAGSLFVEGAVVGAIMVRFWSGLQIRACQDRKYIL